jgi:ketosteroid isomerase-like protein
MASRNIETLLRLAQGANYDDLTSDQSNHAALDAYAPDFVLVEPPSLPHAGTYRGRGEWQRMHDYMRELWQQKLTVEKRWDVPEEDVVVMRTKMEWTANATGRSAAWPTIQVLWFSKDAQISRIEIFHQDTKAILDTLDDETRAAARLATDPSYAAAPHAWKSVEPAVPSRNLLAYRRMQQEAEFEHDITSDKSRQAMWDNFTSDYEIIEPASLPHGGLHKGREEWATMNATMRSLWAQQVVPVHVWDVPSDDLIILYSEMEFTARATGKTVRFPAIELLYYRDEKIRKVEMFLQDAQVILDTLEK